MGKIGRKNDGVFLITREAVNRVVIDENKKVAEDQGWSDKVPASYHQFTAQDGKNVKYVSPDGYKEVVYDAAENIVTAPEDIGTYNFYPSNKDGARGLVGHFFKDMLPWYIWGNSPDDTTTWYERVLGRKIEIQRPIPIHLVTCLSVE